MCIEWSLDIVCVCTAADIRFWNPNQYKSPSRILPIFLMHVVYTEARRCSIEIKTSRLHMQNAVWRAEAHDEKQNMCTHKSFEFQMFCAQHSNFMCSGMPCFDFDPSWKEYIYTPVARQREKAEAISQLCNQMLQTLFSFFSFTQQTDYLFSSICLSSFCQPFWLI